MWWVLCCCRDVWAVYCVFFFSSCCNSLPDSVCAPSSLHSGVMGGRLVGITDGLWCNGGGTPQPGSFLVSATFQLGWYLVWERWTGSVKPGTCGLWFPSAAGWIMLSKLVPTAEASLQDVLRTENHKSWAVQQGEFLTLRSSNPGLFRGREMAEKDCFSAFHKPQ